MISAAAVIAASVFYLAMIFIVASWGDRMAARGRAVLGSPWIYTLSLAVFCSGWTFYGSIGLAERGGLAFLPVYLGPTLLALVFPFVALKIVRIAKAYGLTSIADFLASRYGKSGLLGGLVTVVAIIVTVPYISIQLKAVAQSADAMLPGGASALAAGGGADTALLVTFLLALFAILFGTRNVDATLRHEGLVLAVAVDSVVKLVVFLAAGAVVTWIIADDLGGLLRHLAASGRDDRLMVGGTGPGYADWFLLTLVSGLAFLTLPRQFQMAVIENVDEDHLRTASWALPLYLLAINIFVLPLAAAGSLLHAGSGDLFLIQVPLVAGHPWLAMLVYVGGLSAATAMVIVDTVALSTMISNDLVMPLLLRLPGRHLSGLGDLGGMVLVIRRGAILLLLLCGYAFYRGVGEHYGLASIGLIAFTGVAQFAPPILAGIYWKEANRQGAILGLLAGVAVWAYTLVLPTLADSGLIDGRLAGAGPFATDLLRPHALFGLTGLGPVAHATLWSLAANLVCLLLCGLLGRQSDLERVQAVLFVDVMQRQGSSRPWRGEAHVAVLRGLLGRFVGQARADAVFAADARRRGRTLTLDAAADAALVDEVEQQLGRAIGATSARVVIGSVVRGEAIGPGDLMQILEETSQAIEYGRRLEQRSAELERATADLRLANERLLQLDEVKDDFVAVVSHELRTPLTSIRSFSEILLETEDLSQAERDRFLTIVVRESERLTRLVNDVLDLSKIASGRMDYRVVVCDLVEIVEEAIGSSSRLLIAKHIALEQDVRIAQAAVRGDRDRLIQVVINLLSNAVKFVPAAGGRIRVSLTRDGDAVMVRIEDNGPGVAAPLREAVFERFHQLADAKRHKPEGTGLGLTIARQIVEHFGGRIWLEDASLGGAALCFTLPCLTVAPNAA